MANKEVPKWIFQTPIEMFEKTKRGSKNYRYIFRQHKTKLFPTTWDKALDDVTITNVEVNKKLKWLSYSELSQDIVDRAQRFIYRKTKFNDQLSKYAKSGVTSNICSYCFLTEKKQIKETPLHCVYSCIKVQGIYDYVIRSLHLEDIIPLPTTPKRTLIWDEDCKAPHLANAIWTIITNEILTYRNITEKLDFDKVKNVVKGEIIASITAYSNKNLSREIGKLGLLEFFASYPVTGV